MTLPASGPISINDIAAEFGVASSTPFPSGFYGKGGAPSSGALSFADFYGRSNFTLSANRTALFASGTNASQTAIITSTVSTTFSFSGTNARCTASQTDGTHAQVKLQNPATGSGSTDGTVRVTASNGDFIDITFDGDWGGGGTS